MAAKLRWTKADERVSVFEGWSVFDCGGYSQIQRVDDPEAWDMPVGKHLVSDLAAVRLVNRKARAGSKLHQKALKLHHKS